MSCRLTELAYCHDSARLFTHIAGQPWSIFLDSGYPYIDAGRYDIMSAQPYIKITTCAGRTTIDYAGGGSESSPDDPFDIVEKLLGENGLRPAVVPFAGGALGYFAYDLGRRIESIPAAASRDIDMPDMAIGIYDWAVVTDHHQRRTWLAGYGRDPATLAQWEQLKKTFQRDKAPAPGEFKVCSELESNMDKRAYATAFNSVKRYIRRGDCYQINLARRFSIKVSGDPWAAYLRLRRLNPAPYGAYFKLPEGTILSTSPERFLKVDQGLVESKPIKGTRRRSFDPAEDRQLGEELLESAKDRAENLMIVDLIRNDIGKLCRYGSVAVPQLFTLESFARVHHLVSTVTGRMIDNSQTIALLRGCFPGGSITGAPKVRAMEIIETLEPHRRSVYCGSIAYIGFDRNMDSNVAIRTLIHHRDHMYCWGGGGLVFDSVLNAEYCECFDKVRAIFAMFEAGR